MTDERYSFPDFTIREIEDKGLARINRNTATILADRIADTLSSRTKSEIDADMAAFRRLYDAARGASDLELRWTLREDEESLSDEERRMIAAYNLGKITMAFEQVAQVSYKTMSDENAALIHNPRYWAYYETTARDDLSLDEIVERTGLPKDVVAHEVGLLLDAQHIIQRRHGRELKHHLSAIVASYLFGQAYGTVPANSADLARMHAIEALRRYLSLYPGERDRLAQLCDQIASQDAKLFERSNMVGHITTSAFIVDHACEQALLIHHKAYDRWLQPGGHYEMTPYGILWDSAGREATEETGAAVRMLPEVTGHAPLDIDTHAIAARPAKQELDHWHHDLTYLGVADRSRPLVHQEEEVQAAEWRPLPEVAQSGDERVQRLAHKAMKLAPAIRQLLAPPER